MTKTHTVISTAAKRSGEIFFSVEFRVVLKFKVKSLKEHFFRFLNIFF